MCVRDCTLIHVPSATSFRTWVSSLTYVLCVGGADLVMRVVCVSVHSRLGLVMNDLPERPRPGPTKKRLSKRRLRNSRASTRLQHYKAIFA